MKGASGIILITDAMRAKGMAYDDYNLGVKPFASLKQVCI